MWILLILLACSLAVEADPLQIDRSRARDLESWKPQIAAYSQRHYGENEWLLVPRCIVLHYTAGKTFPQNLVDSTEFAGEKPGLASHYVIDGAKVWELLPPNVRSRAAFGINHRAINIEMVAANATDLYGLRRQTMDTCAELVVDLMERFDIPLSEIYSHQQVATMDKNVVPWVLDLVNPEPYDKIDPGEQPMRYIKARIRELL